MFKLGMKGSIGVIIGSIAIILILFGVNTANNISEQNQTFLNLQVAKETALETENLIRMLDKATSKVIYDIVSTDPACAYASIGNFQSEYENIIDDFIDETSSPLECIVTASPSGNGPIIVSGTLDCSIGLGDFRATDIRSFRFEKEIISIAAPSCSVEDTASGCQEQPSFSC